MAAHRVVVLGGGLSGLACAYHLSRWLPKTTEICLIEKSNRVGGWVETAPNVPIEADRKLSFELGPRTLRPKGYKGWATLSLIDELGLMDSVITGSKRSSAAKYRWTYHPKAITPVPTSFDVWRRFRHLPLVQGFVTGALTEAFRPTLHTTDETVHDFFLRRFGPTIADHFASALVHGIYAGDAKKLSIRSCFPSLWKAEQDYGSITNSVIWSALDGHQRAQRTLEKTFKETITDPDKLKELEDASVYSLRGGLGYLPSALLRKLKAEPNVTLKGNTNLRSIEKTESGLFRLTNAKNEVLEAGRVVSAIPFSNLQPLMAPFAKVQPIVSTSVQAVSFAFPQTALLVPGFGMLFPSNLSAIENPWDALGVVFDSQILPGFDGPDGEGYCKLTVMLGGHYYDENRHIPSPDEAFYQAGIMLAKTLGVTSLAAYHRVASNVECIPQYYTGHRAKLDQIDHVGFAHYRNKLSLIGSSYLGVGVNDVLYEARETAWLIAKDSDAVRPLLLSKET